MTAKKNRVVLIAAFFVQSLVVLHASRHLSPTWDEIAYPSAGLAQIKTRQLDLNTVNPFLAKTLYAIPLMFTKAELPLSDPSWANKDEYRFGFAFTYRNQIRPGAILFLSRLPLLCISLVLTWFVFWWMTSLWGPRGGWIASLALMTTPVFLSRATLAQLEMPMFAFFLAALWFHCEWFKTNRKVFLVCASIAIGLSALCKFVILPLLPGLLILNLFFHPQKPSLKQRFVSLPLLVLPAVLTIVLAYLPWIGGGTALKNAITNVVTFDKILPFYWAGHTYEAAPSLLSWAAWLVKAPLHVIVLGWWGALAWRKSAQYRIEYRHFLMVLLAWLGSVFFFKNAVSTIQLSPIYFGLVGLSASLAHILTISSVNKVVIGLFILGAVDVFSVHPNYGAYFNRLVGGSDHGYKWLADSDQDWGQSLPALSAYLNKNQTNRTVLCYSGSGDPTAHGIAYQDLLSPALVTREQMETFIPLEEKKLFLAIGTKVLQSERPFFQWLEENRKPLAIVGQTFLVYDLSEDADGLQWMSEIYRQTNRNRYAQIALERARRLQEN